MKPRPRDIATAVFIGLALTALLLHSLGALFIVR
jgi:hypothetical protein